MSRYAPLKFPLKSKVISSRTRTRAVRIDPRGDGGVGEGVRLRRERAGPQERDRDERQERCSEPAQFENWTAGASRVAPSVSK